MNHPIVSASDIERHYRTLHRIGCLGDGPEAGFLRAGYSPEESEAHAYIHAEAERLGLAVVVDPIGNLFAETPGFSEYIETGSHLDTVVRGGNYDGAAGVVAGLEAVRSVLESGAPRTSGLRLCVWRLEESSCFNHVLFGSSAAYGVASKAGLDRVFSGTTLRDAIRSQGFDPVHVERGEPTLDRARRDSTIAHIELHIEQASALEVLGLDIGVVTSVRGPARFRVTLEGRFDHSGGTPMGVAFRRDANLAFAYISVRLDELARHAIESGNDLVQTIGVVNTERAFNEREPRVYQNQTPKVSGYCYFTYDVRSDSKRFRTEYIERAERVIRDTAAEFGVSATVDSNTLIDPTESLDPRIRSILVEGSNALGYSCREMASGGLHDVVNVGAHHREDGTSPAIGMIFIPCRDGISHNEAEFTSYEAIARGANLLAYAMRTLSTGDSGAGALR